LQGSDHAPALADDPANIDGAGFDSEQFLGPNLLRTDLELFRMEQQRRNCLFQVFLVIHKDQQQVIKYLAGLGNGLKHAHGHVGAPFDERDIFKV
jgi:hypothetical protein